MTILSNNELQKITKLFSFGGFCASAICNDEAKILYDAFIRVAQTETGSSLLRQIYNSDDKLPISINRYYGSDKAGSVGSVHDESGKILFQKIRLATNNEKQLQWCLVHELTHILQRRTQGEIALCSSNPEKRFLIDRLSEAEARLNTTKYIHEIMKKTNLSASQELYSSLRTQERFDLAMYKSAVLNKKNEAERNVFMLNYIYNDKQWIKDYHQQNVDVANSQPEVKGIVERQPYANVVRLFQGRLHLIDSALSEDANRSIRSFLDIDKMSDYNPQEMIYRKNNAVIHQGIPTRTQTTNTL